MFFLIIKIRVITVSKKNLEIEIFWGHEVLKLHFYGSKNSRSKNIRTPKYLFCNEEFKFLVQIFHTQFLKQSMFEASEALQKPEEPKKIKTTLFH